MAEADPFLVPLKSLNKIDPANVIQFRLVRLTSTPTTATAELEVDTRGGFKIYDHGLKFEYRSAATLNAPVPLKAEAQPPAKVIQDPFYNEPRAVHERGVRFVLTSDLPMDETGVVRVRFEACSVNTCLLPTLFLVQARVGQTSRPEPKAAGHLGSSNGLGASPSLSSSGELGTLPPQAKTVATPSAAPTVVPTAASIQVSNTEPSPAPPPSVSPTPAPVSSKQKEQNVSLTDTITAEVQRALQGRSWLLFPALFLAGLLMNLTPCVYPMIPITLNVLGRSYSSAHPENSSSGTNLKPAIMYLLGIVIAYASMGVVAGMTGSLFGGLLQSKLVNGVLAVLMFTLGLAMLDAFDLSKIQSAANRIPISRNSPHLSVVTMGAVSGLVAAPCTGPVLSMLLLLVGQTKDPLYGFVLMSVFAAGFGAPYVALGLVSQQTRRLPKAGAAMTLVKNIFAALMFSLALYYLKPLVKDFPIVAMIYVEPPLVGVIAIALLTLVFALLQIRNPRGGMSKIGVQIGLSILSLWLALAAIKGFVASDGSVFPALSRINNPVDVPEVKPQQTDRVQWYKNWKEAERAALEQKKGLIVDAWAQWCAACLKMDAEVWNEPGVEALINQHFIALKIDFTESNPQSEELTQRWELTGLPAVGIYPAGSDFSAQPAVLFREAVTVSTFHQAIQKIFNGEIQKK